MVDAIEPIAFVLLALMVFGLISCRSNDSHRWLATALLLLALLRVNQVLFYWTDFLSLRCYDTATSVILRPLALAAWTLAWRDWFHVSKYPWLRYSISGLAVIYAVFALTGRPWFLPGAPHTLKVAADTVVEGVRVAYAALYLWIVALGVIRSARPSSYLAALAAILVGIGLFAGVARGQYAYAAFIPLLFLLILMRSAGYARRR